MRNHYTEKVVADEVIQYASPTHYQGILTSGERYNFVYDTDGFVSLYLDDIIVARARYPSEQAGYLDLDTYRYVFNIVFHNYLHNVPLEG